MIERLARVPVEVNYASEFRYREPLLDAETLTLLITQSGETADTIAGQREAKARLSKTLAICNVLSSMVPREAHGTIYTHAGPEIGVGSTKTFTAQLTALYLFAVYLRKRANACPWPRPRNFWPRSPHCPSNWRACCKRTMSLKTSRGISTARRIFFSSAAACTSRWRWKAP